MFGSSFVHGPTRCSYVCLENLQGSEMRTQQSPLTLNLISNIIDETFIVMVSPQLPWSCLHSMRPATHYGAYCLARRQPNLATLRTVRVAPILSIFLPSCPFGAWCSAYTMLADSLLLHFLRKYLNLERVAIALNGTVLIASVDKRLCNK